MIKKLLTAGVGLFLLSCQSTDPIQGPYFANGIKNGWADQNSIVLWTRLTQNKSAHFKGHPFAEISREKMKSLAQNQDVEGIYKTQIPEGLTLKDMEGYCPGASGEVQLHYYLKDHPVEAVVTDWVAVDSNKDFTHQWKLDDLQAGKKYRVKIYARPQRGQKITDSIFGQFLLPADENTPKDIKFCVVSCHDYNRRDDMENGHKIYPSMSKLQPDFYVHTGDIEYMDKPFPYAMTEELMRFKWNRLFALPFQRSFYNNHTSYFMKDDHDVGYDDSYPGKDYGTVTFERGLEIFDEEQFPTYSKRYKTIRWGKDLQIWIVEGRNYRNQNYLEDGPDKTIWGATQKQWFYDTVNASEATFKILITSSPILGPDRKNKNDNLSNSGYSYEQEEILNFIKKQNNLFIVNGDRHWQYVTHIKNTKLWEFGCGAGADVHAGGWKQEDLRPEHQFLRVKGGFLSVSVSSGNLPSIEFTHHDVEGNPVNEVSF
ncbi:MAG: alkaline phosphatase D family protein [Flavobacteriaceae bacterium]